MSQTFAETLSLIKSDMQVRASYENKSFNALRVVKFLFNPAIFSLMIYRFQRFFYYHHLGIIASILKVINGIIFTVHIDSTAKIGPGFFMMHASYICIGPNVTIGKNCMMAHQNSVCPSPFFSEKFTNSAQGPVIGDDLILGGGAAIYGDITLGNRVKVSMNSSVEASFGDDAVLFGVPARNMAKHAEESEA